MPLAQGQSCSKVNPICSTGDKLLLEGVGRVGGFGRVEVALIAWNRSSGRSIGAAAIGSWIIGDLGGENSANYPHITHSAEAQ